MTAKELKQKLAEIPDDAEVYLECDHGQNKEYAGYVVVSRSLVEELCDPDSMVFECDNWRDAYDEDYVDEYDENGNITAVLISH